MTNFKCLTTTPMKWSKNSRKKRRSSEKKLRISKLPLTSKWLRWKKPEGSRRRNLRELDSKCLSQVTRSNKRNSRMSCKNKKMNSLQSSKPKKSNLNHKRERLRKSLKLR